MNTLYYGDNLYILREYVRDESVDLIYLDPPFNSSRNYNVLFKDDAGRESEAQVHAFKDTWTWTDESAREYQEIVDGAPDNVVRLVAAMRSTLSERSPMAAYVVGMAIRLVEMHRVLKPTGSLYLHCDPTASHYLKLVLDAVFEARNFRNEISWRRSNPKSHHSTNFANCRDVILRYSKSSRVTFHRLFGSHDPAYVASAYKRVDAEGRAYQLLPLLNPNDNRPNLTYEFLGVRRVWRWTKERMEQALEQGLIVQARPGAVPRYKKYLDESEGRTITNDWNDIQQVPLNESLGYPTQKPLALMERILQASSNPGDVVLDPFCGCGTTVAAAQRLGREWIGIDITSLAVALIESRVREMFPGVAFSVVGFPVDLAGARKLALQDRYQFQWWALALLGARPLGAPASGKAGKKGADRGVDGVINFTEDARGTLKRVVVQVKSGSVKSGDVRDLVGTLDRENAVIGVFVTLSEPTREMRTEAASAGLYRSEAWGRDYPRLQMISVLDLLQGATVQMPPAYGTFKQAQRVRQQADQAGLDLIDDGGGAQGL